MAEVIQPVEAAVINPTKNNLSKIALIGNPNSGKSSLFNQLTGLNQKVGNFPGVTVDKKTGFSQLTPQHKAQVIDLPGTYSLYPKSLDEKVIIDLLYNKKSELYPDLIIITVDASNLKRNLLLYTQLADLGIPAVLGLNMTDVAEKHGVNINTEQLQKDLGVPVVPMNARNGIGITALKIVIAQQLDKPAKSFFDIPADLLVLVRQIRYYFELQNDYLALQYAHQYKKLSFLSDSDKEYIEDLLRKYDFDSNTLQAAETIERYTLINELLLDSVKVTKAENNEKFSNRLDQILTHKVWGYFIFFSVLFLMFQAIFAWATYPMDMIDLGIATLNNFIQSQFDGPLVNLLTEGVIAGLGGVLIFIPQIAILFAFIAILEETGYMARVTFMMDKIMRKFGLNGKSIVPLISGVACAVPAVMAARNIDNWKDRMITIFVTPLMSCSARIPVYTVLIALVVPARYYLGFNLQGIVLMGLYLLGFLAAILSAWVMKLILKTKERSYFIMEFPVYKMPRWKNVGITIVEKVKTFVFEAGKVIVAISIILWVLASYGPGNAMQEAEQRSRQEATAQKLSAADTEMRVSAERLESSYAGLFGRTIEPAIRPLGYDWKIGIALLTSFAAREVFIGTISTIYSVGGDDDNISTIKEKLLAEKDAAGNPFFTPARAFSLLIFYVFAMQCMSTLAVVYRETRSWQWPLMQLIYMSGLAYVSAYVVYQLFS